MLKEKKEIKELKEEDLNKVSGGHIVDHAYCRDCKRNFPIYYANNKAHCRVCDGTNFAMNDN